MLLVFFSGFNCDELQHPNDGCDKLAKNIMYMLRLTRMNPFKLSKWI